MTFIGVTSTVITDGATTTPITITRGSSHTGSITPETGNVVLFEEDYMEYIFSDGLWHSLGLASSYALANHFHGNINTDGTLQTTDVAIASGDKLVITDTTNSGLVTRSSLAFGTATDTFLRNDGTWQTPTNTTYSAGSGLSLSGTTINHTASITAGTAGSSTDTSGITLDIPYITYNATGHITATGTHTHTISNMGAASSSAAGTAGLVPAPAKGAQAKFLRADGTWQTPTNTKYTAGTGLSLSSTTFNHSNSITAKDAYGSTATTASANGGTITVTDIQYDTEGHITSSTDRTITLSQVDTKNTAGATTSSDKLYIIGATTQNANPQTYSNANVYETAGVMYANNYVGHSTVEYIKGTQTAATGSWTGTSKRSSLQDGDLIAYYLPVAGSGNASLNLTLADGTTTGAKEIYRYAKTTRITTHFSAGSILFMAYNAANDVWNIQNWYDTTVDYRLKNNNNSTAATATAAGTLAVGSSAGYKQVASGVTFTLDYPIMYNGTARAANAVNCNDLYYDKDAVNLQTTKSSWTGTQWSTVYLVGTLTNQTVTIDSSVFTTTIPNSADGKVYFPIGVLYSTYQCHFHPTGQMFAYLNNRFSQVSPKDIKTITRSGNTFTATRVDGETFTFNYEQGSVSTNYTATIGTSWTGTTAPYTQTITVTGIKAADIPIVDIYLADTDYEDVEDELTAYSYIYRITTAANAITVYASEPTDVPIKIQMKVC